MSIQHIVTLVIVAAAALYLGRSLFAAARGFFSNKTEGCGGCGKCGFAEKTSGKAPNAGSGKTIALSEIRTIAKK